MIKYKRISLLIFVQCFFASISPFTESVLFSSEISIPENTKENYEINFTSTISDQYFQQVSEKAKELKNLPEEFKILLVDAQGQAPKEKKNTHEAIITLLRDLLDRKDEIDPIVLEDIDALSFLLITETDNFLEQEKVLRNYVDLSDEAIEFKPLPELIQEIYTTLSKKFADTDHYSKNPTKFDAHYEGFLPSRLFTIGISQYIYMFNPIMHDKTTKEESISPIFPSYLRHLKKINKKHLYLNVMSRVNELEQLAESAEFKDVFMLVTLDKSTEFYHQKNNWLNKNDTKEFKAIFEQNLLTNSVNFQWHSEFQEHGWNEIISNVIEHVHSSYFENAPTLDASQRGAFIEISYAIIMKEMRLMYKPDYINATCRFTIDRGPSQYALEYAYDIIEKNGQLTTEEKRNLLNLFYTSPLISHYRTSHDYRVNRLSATMGVLQESWLFSSGFKLD